MMGGVIRLAIVGFIIQFGGLVAFLAIVRLDLAGQEILVGLVCIATFILLIVAVDQLDLTRSILLAAFLTVSFSCAFELLSFTHFPGLVKDIELFSPNHLTALAQGMAILFGAYALSILVIWTVMRLLKIPKRSICLKAKEWVRLSGWRS
jgi:hypothetical protein